MNTEQKVKEIFRSFLNKDPEVFFDSKNFNKDFDEWLTKFEAQKLINELVNKKEWRRPTIREIIVNMKNKNFREEIILEEVVKELDRLDELVGMGGVSERNIKYFIEDKQTGKWLTIGEPYHHSNLHGELSDPQSKWTNDPQIAIQFNTRKEAKEWNKKYHNMNGIEVTEHEFVSSESAPTADMLKEDNNFHLLWDWSIKVLKALVELVRLKDLKEKSKLGRPSSSEELLEHENKKEAAWQEARKIISDFSIAHKKLMEILNQ